MKLLLLVLLLVLPIAAHGQSCTPNNNNIFGLSGTNNSTLSTTTPQSAGTYTAAVIVNMSGVSNSGTTCYPVAVTGQASGSGNGALAGSILPPGNWTVVFDEEFNGNGTTGTISPGAVVGDATQGVDWSQWKLYLPEGQVTEGNNLYPPPVVVDCSHMVWESGGFLHIKTVGSVGINQSTANNPAHICAILHSISWPVGATAVYWEGKVNYDNAYEGWVDLNWLCCAIDATFQGPWEVDVMEVNSVNNAQGTYGGEVFYNNWAGYQQIIPIQTLPAGWHTIGIEMDTQAGTTLYVDGVNMGGANPWGCSSSTPCDFTSGGTISTFNENALKDSSLTGYQNSVGALADWQRIYFRSGGGGGGPTVTVNGTSSGATVSAGSSMTVAVTGGWGGSGGQADRMFVCAAGQSPSTGCAYGFLYLSGCQTAVPTVGVTSGTCTMTAPSSAGSYTVNLYGNTADWNVIAATAPFTVTGGGGGGACTAVGGTYNNALPSPIPCPVGVAAPSGYHWNLTFYDDFTADSSLNGSYWIAYGDTGGGWYSCCDATNGFQLAGTMNMQSGSTLEQPPNMRQSGYGYWEFSWKQPASASGQSDGVELDMNFNVGGSSKYLEQDINNKIMGPYNTNYSLTFIETGTGGGSGTSGQVYANFYTADGSDLSANWHTIGMEWLPNGSYGTLQNFFDGSSALGPVTILADPENSLPSGFKFATTVFGCPNSKAWGGGVPCDGSSDPYHNPVKIRYARRWALVPG